MSSIDYAILVVIVFSASIGVWRGFVREALSLVVWVAAFWFAYSWSQTLAFMLDGFIADPGLRLIVTFVVLFLAVHIVGFVVSRLLSVLIRSVGLKGVDRVAGGGFGLLRGIIIISVLVLLAEMTPITQEVMWQQSFMVSVFKDALEWVQLNYSFDEVGDALVATGYELF